jgi:hypothetical protein
MNHFDPDHNVWLRYPSGWQIVFDSSLTILSPGASRDDATTVPGTVTITFSPAEGSAPRHGTPVSVGSRAYPGTMIMEEVGDAGAAADLYTIRYRAERRDWEITGMFADPVADLDLAIFNELIVTLYHNVR